MNKHTLGAESHLLGLYHAKGTAIVAECVVSRAVTRLELFDRCIPIGAQRHRGVKTRDFPTRSLETGIDALLARLLFEFFRRHIRVILP